MSKKTLALIVTLLVLTIVLLTVAFYTRDGTKETPVTTSEEETTTSPTPDMAKSVLRLAPNPLNVTTTSSTSAVTVEIETENEVSAVQLEIAYDPRVLSNMRITAGDFFANPTVLPVGGVNQSTGRITFAVAPGSLREVKSGSGTVATLTFTPNLSAGVAETEITILDKSLVTARGVAESVLKESAGTRIILPVTNNAATGSAE